MAKMTLCLDKMIGACVQTLTGYIVPSYSQNSSQFSVGGEVLTVKTTLGRGSALSVHPVSPALSLGALAISENCEELTSLGFTGKSNHH